MHLLYATISVLHMIMIVKVSGHPEVSTQERLTVRPRLETRRASAECKEPFDRRLRFFTTAVCKKLAADCFRPCFQLRKLVLFRRGNSRFVMGAIHYVRCRSYLAKLCHVVPSFFMKLATLRWDALVESFTPSNEPRTEGRISEAKGRLPFSCLFLQSSKFRKLM